MQIKGAVIGAAATLVVIAGGIAAGTLANADDTPQVVEVTPAPSPTPSETPSPSPTPEAVVTTEPVPVEPAPVEPAPVVEPEPAPVEVAPEPAPVEVAPAPAGPGDTGVAPAPVAPPRDIDMGPPPAAPEFVPPVLGREG